VDSTSTEHSLPNVEPLILSRSEHPISRKDIGENALKVLYRLSNSGFHAYLVGGGVRDLFLKKKPKDFDVATDARPSRLKKLFKNCRIIGRRFRIAHVYFPEGNIVEVSTFRRGAQTTIKTAKGTILSDNEYGSSQEDALRRDLTINGLFYDIESFEVIDYVGGVKDLQDRIVRTIADPNSSFLEDPVRMIRVQRHAARTGFEIESATLGAIFQNRHQIQQSNPARLLEETLKDLRGGAAAPFYRLMMETHLLDALLPTLGRQLRDAGPDHPFWRRAQSLDRCTSGGRSFTPPLLLGVLLHTVLFTDPDSWTGLRNNPPDVWRFVTNNWNGASQGFRISRRDTERMTQILVSFRKLIQSYEHGRLVPSLARKPYLAEALDFLELELTSQGKPTEILQEWRKVAPPPAAPEPRYRTAEDGGRRPPLRRSRRGAPSPTEKSPTGNGVEKVARPRRRRRRRGSGSGSGSGGPKGEA
jgi:poly(A) polymerase